MAVTKLYNLLKKYYSKELSPSDFNIIMGIASQIYEIGNKNDSEKIQQILADLEEIYHNQQGGENTEGKADTIFAKRAGGTIRECLEQIEERYHGPFSENDIPSGFEDIDCITGGFRPGQLYVVASPPGAEKTFFALSMADHAAIVKNIPVAYFSQGSAVNCVRWLIAARSRISSYRLITGTLQTADFDAMTAACEAIYESPLYLVDMPMTMKLPEIIIRARYLRNKSKIKILFIDGFIMPHLKKFQKREAAVQKFKNLARELNIPIVLSIRLPAHIPKKYLPGVHGLDIFIENYADNIFLLKRGTPDKEYGIKKHQVVVDILKNKNGPTCPVHLDFIPMYSKFENKETASHND
jgi:replicative DNA helicase